MRDLPPVPVPYTALDETYPVGERKSLLSQGLSAYWPSEGTITSKAILIHILVSIFLSLFFRNTLKRLDDWVMTIIDDLSLIHI